MKDLTDVKKVLINEVKDEMDGIKSMDYASEEYESMINSTAKLVDKIATIEEKENEKIDILLRNGTNLVIGIGGLVMSGIAVNKTFEFDGSDKIFTSTLGKSIVLSFTKPNFFKR